MDVRELVDDVVAANQPLAESPRLPNRLGPSLRIRVAAVDPRRIERVVRNLLSERHRTRAGEPIDVRVRGPEDAIASLCATTAGGSMTPTPTACSTGSGGPTRRVPHLWAVRPGLSIALRTPVQNGGRLSGGVGTARRGGTVPG